MFFYSTIRRPSSSSQAEGGTIQLLKKKNQISKFSLDAPENFKKQLIPPQHFLEGEEGLWIPVPCKYKWLQNYSQLFLSKHTISIHHYNYGFRRLQTPNTENLHRAHSSTRQSIDHMDYLYNRGIAWIPSKWRKPDTGNSLPTTTVMMDSSLHRGHTDCIVIGFGKPKRFQHIYITTLLSPKDDSDGRNQNRVILWFPT